MVTTLLAGCEVDQPGARCDGFFSNGCKSPLGCLTVEDKKICAAKCDTTFKCKQPDGCCPAGQECVEADSVYKGQSIGKDRYCLPR